MPAVLETIHPARDENGEPSPPIENSTKVAARGQFTRLAQQLAEGLNTLEELRVQLIGLKAVAGEPAPPGLAVPFYGRSGADDPRVRIGTDREHTKYKGMVVANEAVCDESLDRVVEWTNRRDKVARNNKRRRSLQALDEVGLSDDDDEDLDFSDEQQQERATSIRRDLRSLLGNGWTVEEILMPGFQSADVPPANEDL
ncbi:MAG: hypothetical protein SGILL_004403 [Bacillariaceae sp.]